MIARRAAHLTHGAVLLAGLLGCAACSETVGYLSLELVLLPSTPPVVCDGDPRRVVEVEIIITHEDGAVTRSFAIEDPPPDLVDIPLGEVTIEVATRNRFGAINRTGASVLTIDEGQNPPVGVLLLEELCTNPLCDGDGDNLPDRFEEAMGTDTSKSDTDGDGLEDGLEARECCSDPLSESDLSCENLIQRVIPNSGLVGDPVLIKAATNQQGVTAALGGVPLDGPLVDGQQVFGYVGPGAVLGEVTLSSAGQTSTYRELFAVLTESPRGITELDRGAGAMTDLITTTIDMVHFENRLYILGQSQPRPGEPPAITLLIINRLNQTSWRLPVPPVGHPVALAIGPRWGLVLFQAEQDQAKVLLFDNINQQSPPPKIVVLPIPLADPISIHLEPGRGVAQVLGRTDILRINLNAAGQSPQISLRPQLGQAEGPTDPRSHLGCTGMAYLPEQSQGGTGHSDAIYIACNVPPEECAGQPCAPSGVVFQLGPVNQCLPLTGAIPGADLAGSCWVRHTADPLDQVRGAPTVDQKAQTIYQRVTSGLAAIDASTVPVSPLPMAPRVQYRWQSEKSTSRSMVLNQAGQLFAVDGSRVWRLLPRQTDPLLRLGSSFNPAAGALIQQLLLSADNTVLDLGTQDQGNIPYLSSLCLNRCKDCICDQIQ